MRGAMPVLWMIFGVVMLLLLGVGVGVGLFACLIAAALTGLGVVSSSVAVGLYTRRPAAAVRLFLLQCGVLAGLPAGAVCAWLGQQLYSAWSELKQTAMVGVEWKVPLFGALGGALAGAVLALLLDFCLRRVCVWVEARRAAVEAATKLPG